MRAHKLLTLLALVILLLTLTPGSVRATPAGPEAGLAPSIPLAKGRDLTPAVGIVPERNPGIESLSGSNVTFNPAAGGATCFAPGATQTFCFDAYTQTNDWEWVYHVWLSFPSDWTVTDAYVVGTPSCTGGGTWGEMSWSFETTPYAINIGHARSQQPTDSCLATYCVDVVAGTGAPDAMTSWYWDGDGFGNPPYHPCSSDQYTPPSMASSPCDEWTQPQAAVPPCSPVPEITITPPALSQEQCSDQTGAQQLAICNTGDWLLFNLSEVSPALKLNSLQVTLPAGPAAAPAGTAVSAGPYTARPASRYTVERRAGINAAPNVLLLAADGANIIQGLLQAYGDLGVVDYYDARFATPSLVELAAYDVVVTWSNHVYAAPTAIGNVLADYVDTGGKVVNLNFSVGTHGWQMAGRFITENYTAMNAKMLFVMAVEASSLLPKLEAARAAGVKVMVVGGEPGESGRDAVMKLDQFLSGAYAALMAKKWVDERYPDAPDGSIETAVFLSSLNPEAIDRSNGLLMISEPYLKNSLGEYIDATGTPISDAKGTYLSGKSEADRVPNPAYSPQVEVVATPAAEMFQAGQTAMQNILTTNPNVKLVIAYAADGGNGASQAIMDEYAKGATSVIKNLDDVAVFGVGMFGPEGDAIKDSGQGKSVFRGTVAFGGGDLPGSTVAIAAKILSGEDYPAVTWDPLALATLVNGELVIRPMPNAGVLTDAP